MALTASFERCNSACVGSTILLGLARIMHDQPIPEGVLDAPSAGANVKGVVRIVVRSS